MSGLIFDIDDLTVPYGHGQQGRDGPIHFRIIAQFIDMEYSTCGTNNKYFCKILIRNLPALETVNQSLKQDLLLHETHLIFPLYMEENTFEQFFINDGTKIDFQPGDPIDIQTLTWNGHDSNDDTIWEAVNLSRITMEEVDSLRDFILSPQGQHFLNP
ncbi:telomere length regulation protein Ten1p [Monosporozyma unispora]|nr:hypothetical protein C6P44_004793 [Kazachstania unispora]